MKKHILIPIDGEKYSEDVFKWYSEVLHSPSHYVILLNAYPREKIPVPFGSQYLPPDVFTKECEAARTKKREEKESMAMAFRDKMKKKQMSGRIIVKEGRPGKTIVKYAEDENVDVIVIGCGNQKGRATMKYVTQHAKCAVTRVPSRQTVKKAGILSDVKQYFAVGVSFCTSP